MLASIERIFLFAEHPELLWCIGTTAHIIAKKICFKRILHIILGPGYTDFTDGKKDTNENESKECIQKATENPKTELKNDSKIETFRYRSNANGRIE